jgi:hypothetical protein
MATQPMMQQPDPDMDPGADPNGEGAGDVDTGTTELCIEVAQDGNLSVYMEQGEQETGEDQKQPAADIGDALKKVLDMYRQVTAKQGGDPQAQFDSGFKGGTAGATSRMSGQ